MGFFKILFLLSYSNRVDLSFFIMTDRCIANQNYRLFADIESEQRRQTTVVKITWHQIIALVPMGVRL